MSAQNLCELGRRGSFEKKFLTKDRFSQTGLRGVCISTHIFVEIKKKDIYVVTARVNNMEISRGQF